MEIKVKIRKLLSMRIRGYNIGDLVTIVIAFGLVAMIGAVVLLILQNFAANPSIGTTCTGTNTLTSSGYCSAGPTYLSQAANGLVYGTSGINQMMTFLPLIALVVVAAVIIGTVVGAFVLGGGMKKEF